jgi:hypothetical protein
MPWASPRSSSRSRASGRSPGRAPPPLPGRRQAWRSEPTAARFRSPAPAVEPRRGGRARGGGEPRHQPPRVAPARRGPVRAGRAPPPACARCRSPAAPPRRSGRRGRPSRPAPGRGRRRRPARRRAGSSRWPARRARDAVQDVPRHPPTASSTATSSSPAPWRHAATGPGRLRANPVAGRRPGRRPNGSRRSAGGGSRSTDQIKPITNTSNDEARTRKSAANSG